MATNRLEILKQMLAQDPDNSFARYGVAMELKNTGQFAEAVREFEALLAADASYVAAYYHGGQALEQLGQVAAAKSMYETGIEASTRKGDLHTRAEIEGALSLLPA